ncbi:MAG TPA: DUF4186 family protein [Patescibacteria group bacterium]|nr:DUF4186 family protein [Patescibacteria group bacterium]
MTREPAKQAKDKNLKVTCTSTDCKNNLHCFKLTQKLRKTLAPGQCRTCGIDLVDFKRIFRRDVGDLKYTFKCLKYEMIRHHYWHVTIPERALRLASRKGLAGLKEAVTQRIKTAIGTARPFMDGRQTPRETSKSVTIIHLGQHATATCCRKCVEYWHGIPQGRPLTDAEIAYLSNLIMMYVIDRMPDLRLQ